MLGQRRTLAGMTPPPWGIVVVLVAGIVLVVVATILDRTRTRRAPEVEVPPPQGGPLMPSLDVEHVDEADLPEAPTGTEPDAEVGLLQRRGDAATLPGGVPDGRFLNHPRKGLAILADPSVLVTDTEVTSERDLQTVLTASRRRGRPLVWVATGFSREVIAGLRANAVTNRVPNLPIELGDPLHLRRAVAYTGGRLVSRADLAADWLPDEVWGTCAGWLADTEDSWVVPPGDDADLT